MWKSARASGGPVSYQPSDPLQTPPPPSDVRPPMHDPERRPAALPPQHQPMPIEQSAYGYPAPYQQPMAPAPYYQPVPMVAYAAPIPKSKATAVLLAIFFGYWTWLYTYRRDAALFWINLVASFITVGAWWVLVSWPWAVICTAVRPSDTFYANYPYGR